MAGIESRLARMGIPLDEEQLLIAATARTFATWRLVADAASRDENGQFPDDEVHALGDLGLLAMKVPVEDGGAGTDHTGYVLAMEAIAEACASTAVVLASSNLAASILVKHGTATQKQQWLRPYVEGKLGPASFALSEPGCGSDAGALTTSARWAADGWVLSGSKAWITNGAHAGFHLVFARTDGPGRDGISCFVVERGTPGLVVGKSEDKMGQRSSGTVSLHFDDCRLPPHHLLGARGGGYAIALSALGAGRIGIAALSLGIAEAALAAGLAYARERRAFGQPLVDFQHTQFVLADCRTELDAAWLLTLRAARLLDGSKRATAETSMAKLFASEACGRVVDHVVQLHGGNGYSRGCAVERYYRDARVTRIYEGTSEIQRLVIARELIRSANASA